MECGKLPYSRLFCDFLNQDQKLLSYFEYPHNYDKLKEAVTSFEFTGDRKTISKAISEFNSGFSLEAKAIEHLTALSDENTVTITTGQQVSLFGGPLYTIYKALSIILLANRLTRDTNKRVVPVFWLADEDHDYDEISRVSIATGKGSEHVHLPCKTCEQHAAGMITIGEEFQSFRRDVFDKLPDTDFHKDLTDLLDSAYVKGRTLRHAFGELMARLLSKHGLIFAGSNFDDAKQITTGCFKKAIEKASAIESLLNEQSKRISRTYHQQAQITDSLLFWHDEDHGRLRLSRKNGAWSRKPGERLSAYQLLQTLEEEPERFSPNVFLRPIIQDALLPNAAYAAGPAEIAYYAQMKPLYNLFGQSMPFIAARMTATIVEPPVKRNMTELPFDFPDFAKRLEDLEQNYLRQCGDPDLDQRFEDWKEKVAELSESKINEAGITDPGLHKHTQAITKEHQKAIDKLRKKMVNQVRKKEEVQINRIKKSKNALFPNDGLQERELSFIYVMNKFGITIWDELLSTLEREDGVFTKHYRVDI